VSAPPPKINIELPEAFQFLFEGGYRYYVAYGGRGSAKSTSFCRRLIMLAATQPLRILCTRQFQNSIQDSVYRLLCDSIDAMGLSAYFDIGAQSITSKCGSEFIFKGLARSITEIKSLEGIDICFVEEAQSVGDESWEILIPTIRKENSQIWISFNPDEWSDPTYQRFVVNPPPRSIVRKINYDQNPYFPSTLDEERRYMEQNDPESYENVWLGEPKKISQAVIFKSRVSVEEFETPANARLYYGGDFGYAEDPATLIRCFVKDKCLYIDHEAYGTGVELDDMPAFYDGVPFSRRWIIRADNSRPETISYLRRQGFRIEAAPKWPGSIEDGIAFLKGFQRIIIHPRCPHTQEEFTKGYRWKIDRLTREILPVPVDKNNHTVDAIRYALSPLIKQRGTSALVWEILAS
jgi:phage terminase large subunit